jgi:hypothetical protein
MDCPCIFSDGIDKNISAATKITVFCLNTGIMIPSMSFGRLSKDTPQAEGVTPHESPSFFPAP